jgi:hypothetical protein
MYFSTKIHTIFFHPTHINAVSSKPTKFHGKSPIYPNDIAHLSGYLNPSFRIGTLIRLAQKLS